MKASYATTAPSLRDTEPTRGVLRGSKPSWFHRALLGCLQPNCNPTPAHSIDSDPEAYLSSTKCDEPQREVPATAEVAPGLTAEQAYQLDGYSSMDLAGDDLRVVLLVGSLDPFLCTNPASTQNFGEALEAQGIDVQVIEVDGGGHEDVV